MRKQTIENHTQDKRLNVLFRKFRKMWRVAENRRKMKFRRASENVDNIIVWMRMVESKSQQKIKQKGSARNWTEVIRFKVSYDNQLHHRTFPFFHFQLFILMNHLRMNLRWHWNKKKPLPGIEPGIVEWKSTVLTIYTTTVFFLSLFCLLLFSSFDVCITTLIHLSYFLIGFLSLF